MEVAVVVADDVVGVVVVGAGIAAHDVGVDDVAAAAAVDVASEVLRKCLCTAACVVLPA